MVISGISPCNGDFIHTRTHTHTGKVSQDNVPQCGITIYRLYDEKEGNTGFISPRKPIYRRPERVARGRLFRFPRWNKSRIARLFHRVRYLYHTTLSSKLSKATKHWNRPSTVVRSQQKRHFHRRTKLEWERVVWTWKIVTTLQFTIFQLCVGATLGITRSA